MKDYPWTQEDDTPEIDALANEAGARAEEEKVTYQARLIRLLAIKAMFKNGDLDRDGALECLNGPLDPDDPTTAYDDRELLDLSDSLTLAMIFSDGGK